MARIRKINVSQVEGNNDGVLPAGTIVLYEVNGEYTLRIHDGVTAGGVSVSSDRLVNGLKEVILDSDGNLTAPEDIVVGGPEGGHIYIDGTEGANTSVRWINLPVGDDHSIIRAYTGNEDDSTDLNRGRIQLAWQDSDRSGLRIISYDRSNNNIEEDVVTHEWTFQGDGDLVLPEGGDILDSEGNSVLGGGTAVDQNVWVQTFETVEGAPDDVVQTAMSVEYDSEGNLICLFSHALDFTPFSSDNGVYFSVAKISTTGSIIWRARFGAGFRTDGWGLAVDNDAGFIYIAGSDVPDNETFDSKSMLTKIALADGVLQWSKIYDFDGTDSQSPVVDVASDGNPVIVGYSESDPGNYIAVTKVDSTDGSVIWSRKLDSQGYEYAYGMGVGPDGEVVAVGYMDQLGILDAAETLYADPVSNANWTINQTGVLAGALGFDVSFAAGVPTFANISDTAGGRTVDGTVATILGSVLGGADGTDDMVVKVATLAANNTDDHMLVVKYTSTGTIAWQKAVQFDVGYDCLGADCDIDSEGNVYVTGQYSLPEEPGVALSIIKFNSSGVAQWSRRVTGNCETFGSSIVVGADNNLYLSGITAIANPSFPNDGPPYSDTHSVLAKYGTDGTVIWQRLLENSSTWSFTGAFFESGGSNLAVKDGYIAVSGGYGDFDNGLISASVAQVSAEGTVFSVGNWDFVASNFSGTFFDDASDLTVVDAGKTDSDLSGDIAVTEGAQTPDYSNFLIGTIYRAGGSDERLVNGDNELVLESNGTVTLPSGGTISEGIVTSNPTIQLTPATPDVASQKLVIKGGTLYNSDANGINLGINNNTFAVGDTVEIYVYANDYADQTLYWWIVPEEGGIADPGFGSITLDGNFGTITFTVDSDDYEFRVRVSPEENNYDPDSIGVQTVLLNGDAPAYGDHHLHLTTGDLEETSIFLGTDNHNVRTTTDGKIQITTPGEGNNVWEFGTDGSLTFPDDTVQSTAYAGGVGRALMIDTNRTDTYTEVGSADRPFKTFAAAIAAAEESEATAYTFILMGCTVTEDVDFGGTAFTQITISTTCRSVISGDVTINNNSDLSQLVIRNIEIGGTFTLAGDGTTNQMNNCSFYNASFSGPVNITATNAAAFYEVAFFSTVEFTNINYFYVNGAQFNNDWTITADDTGTYPIPSNGIAPALSVVYNIIANDINFVKGGTAVFVFQPHMARMGRSGQTYTVPAGWTMTPHSSVLRGSWVNNGTTAMRNSSSDNAITGTAPSYVGTIGAASVNFNDGTTQTTAWTGDSFLKDIPQVIPTPEEEFYLLQDSDRGRHILINGSNIFSIVVPLDATEPMPVGSAIVLVLQPGAYGINIEPEDAYDALTIHGAGVGTNLAYSIQAGTGGAMATLLKIGANEWMISGTGLEEFSPGP